MKNTSKFIAVLVGSVLLGNTANAWYDWNRSSDNGGSNGNSGNSFQVRAANCSPATALTYLEFNNVKALIETGGSMWQNRSTGDASYEVPAGSNLTVIYAGSLWMGGVDVNNQLKLAALTFRQGEEFWTGPLTVNPGSGNPAIEIYDHGPAEIEPDVCLEYDKFYITTRQEVAEFNAWFECSQDPDCNTAVAYPGYSIPQSILNWPGNGDVDRNQDVFLAPFFDRDGDNYYDPAGDGDYPYYELNPNDSECGSSRKVKLYGDYNMWWIFNDKGNVHTETNSDPIGMEIRAQAFAFATNDEINSMTFYNYEMVNRSTQTLKDTYFGVWVDSDIGCSDDDYVGCDVQRGLGYAFNGDAIDDPGIASCPFPHGANPPAIGVDFFEGPYQDNDGVDNPLTTDISAALNNDGIPYKGLGIGYGDGIPDNERFGMRKFLYFNRDGAVYSADPSFSVDYYNYMKGIWKDGQQFVYGATGHPSAASATSIPCHYTFPGDTDPYNWGTEGAAVPAWDEYTESNPAGDRRFVQSAGPFTLEPGAVNNITVGVVYAKALTGNPFDAVLKLRTADDKAQALFDNCFRILNGPDAPDVTIQELDQELILYLTNPTTSNNYLQSYVETDPIIAAYGGNIDPDYRFQGYKVYQLVNGEVDASQLSESTLARLVAQCDIQDSVTQIINYIFDEDMQVSVPTSMVVGADEGVKHTFRITEDAFAQGDKRLINHKTYYFMAVAYGYNNFMPYDASTTDFGGGQQFPYKEGRKNGNGGAIAVATGIPHDAIHENGGTIINSSYGDGPEITRIEGRGIGRMPVELTIASEDDILSNPGQQNITYKAGKGPFEIRVIDPLNVAAGDYQIAFAPDSDESMDRGNWTLTKFDHTNGHTQVTSDQTIQVGYEQLIPEWGISVTVEQFVEPEIVADPNKEGTVLIESELIFADSSLAWLGGVQDQDGMRGENWIRSGTSSTDPTDGMEPCEDPAGVNDYVGWDDEQVWEKVVDGTWAPYRMVAYGECRNEPLPPSGAAKTALGMVDISHSTSIDVVFTDDRSKWTRCVVLETQDNSDLSWDGNTDKCQVKQMPSLDKYGNQATQAQIDGDQVSTNPNDANYMCPVGMSWFPGYVLDVSSGERLNLAFGEDSWLGNEGGKDMKFNPSGNHASNAGIDLFGGKHYVYIFKNVDRDENNINTFKNGMPAYDNGEYLRDKMIWKNGDPNANPSVSDHIKVWRSCMWVGTPMLAPTASSATSSNDMASFVETEARVRIRTADAYERMSFGMYLDAPSAPPISENNWYGLYNFNLDALAPSTMDDSVAAAAMANVNIVPNPYYAYSNYEFNRLDNLVKIVNLPEECDINIYTVSGTLVRTFKKSSPQTYVDWDLNNQAGIPIASGLYLIHVEATLQNGNKVERVLKWVGAIRPPDLQNF